ncbi:MAG: proline dehydrogenase family protein [Acidobacteria bacterium]|nr:proline dehydrogenase family protein [Acidobacteriota bacterium]
MRALFLYLARRERFKNFALKFGFFRKAAARFIAGDALEDAVRVVKLANRRKLTGTLDLLGENTLTKEDARTACEELIRVEDRIHRECAGCNLSIKLTQIGLKLDPGFCERNLAQIAGHAKNLGNFIRVDMEDSSCTDQTLDIVERAFRDFGNVGTVIQSYLYRSERDTARMLKEGIPIRLVKGAYREPATIAFRRKKDTDANFIRIMKTLLDSEIHHAIATHDSSIIRAAKEYARSRGIPKDSFEFQMLYGIRRDLQRQLAGEGYNVRIYIPFGAQWYAYFMRRLAERPANVAFLVRSMLLERKTNGRFDDNL